jgi:hypothetical protein
MSVKSDIRRMAETLLPRDGQCQGDPQVKFAGFIREGDPEPEPPFCRLCKTRHWPRDLPIWFCVVGRSRPWNDNLLPECY